MTTTLFSSTKIGDLALPNRFVMAPMTRSRADANHVPTPIMAEYYGARAAAGLLITEGTAPDANGCGYARIPGLWNAEQVAGWRAVTRAVHDKGGRIFVQMMHTGRVGHPLNMEDGAQLLAPSAIALEGEMYTDQQGQQPYPEPVAMTDAQVEQAIEGYVTAARNAIDAGFDGVEVHGANGYLIEQFLSPDTNHRTDRWGGNAEGRARFALEVTRRTVEAIGAGRVGIRLSPNGAFNGVTGWATAPEEFEALAKALGAMGLAYLHCVDHQSMGAPPVGEELKERIRVAFGGPIILSGGFDRDSANAALDAGKGALVAFGRPFLANPDLVERFRTGAELNAPDFGTFYTPGPKGYTDYPTLAS